MNTYKYILKYEINDYNCDFTHTHAHAHTHTHTRARAQGKSNFIRGEINFNMFFFNIIN